MIMAIKESAADESRRVTAQRTREFAQFYGIERQQLATALGFELKPS